MAKLIRAAAIAIFFGLITTSILRGIGIFQGDPLIPIMLIVILVISGYLYTLIDLISKDIVMRYNRDMLKHQQAQQAQQAPTTFFNWN
jgi:hypothetical protein